MDVRAHRTEWTLPSSVPSPAGAARRDRTYSLYEPYPLFAPVLDRNQQPLMPTTPARARRWIRLDKATPFWKGGGISIRLNHEPSDRQTQPIAVGIDPGSKQEALVVKSTAHTYLNVQA